MTDEFEALMVGIDPPPKANNSVFITEIDSINPTDAKIWLHPVHNGMIITP